jgi:diguanylate cyclase (GGDEF)-like protein/PAS domain S-box-containing protein
MTRPDYKTDQTWFKQLFESSPDPAWIIDGNRFVECNEAAIRTLGYASRDEFLDVHPSRLSPPRQPDGQDSYAKAEQMMASARENGLHRFEWIHTRADGTDFVAEVTLSVVTLADRQLIYCVWRDITERKSIEEKLVRQNGVLSAILDNFPGAISLVDADLRVVAHNAQFRRLLELPDSLFAKSDLCFEDIIRFNVARGEYGPGDPEEQFAAIVARARDCTPHNLERVRPNGVALDIRGMPLPGGGFVTIYIDITERRAMEEQVRHLAFYDALTNLPNRRLLDDRLRQTMAASKRSGSYGALMFLDLDNFKPLNDAHGHVVGDLLLVEVASRLKGCIRETDTAARFGGDEFVVMLNELNPDKALSIGQAELVAEKIRARLSEPYLLSVKREGQAETIVEHLCTVSIGVSLFINHEAAQDDILKWADAAMYQAKDAGRNSIRFYDPDDAAAPAS